MGKDDAEHPHERPTWAQAIFALWGLRTGAAMLGIVLLSAWPPALAWATAGTVCSKA